MFESIKFTGTFGDVSASDLPDMVVSLYRGEGYLKIKQFSEYMLCVVYIFALIGVAKRFYLTVKKADDNRVSLLKDIPLIIFVGGFLFSIIWEAKARYMLPYYVLLHMYAAYGLAIKADKVKAILSKCSSQKAVTEV